MQNRPFSVLVALTTTLTTNLLNPAVTSLSGPVGITLTQPVLFVRHIRVINKTGNSATFTMYLGATGANAAGTEVAVGKVVAPNDVFDLWYPSATPLRIDSTQFLVGGANTATALVAQINGEVGLS